MKKAHQKEIKKENEVKEKSVGLAPKQCLFKVSR